MTSLKKSLARLMCAALIAPGLAGTAAAQSLDDARAAIRKGTAPGITIIPARSQAASTPRGDLPAASAASAAVTAAPVIGSPSPSAQSAGPTVLPVKAIGGFLSALPPPSGQPLSATKRMNTPDVGIPLPASAPGGR